MHLETEILLTGLAFPESLRWREDRLWFTDQHARKIMTVTSDGKVECVLQTLDYQASLAGCRMRPFTGCRHDRACVLTSERIGMTLAHFMPPDSRLALIRPHQMVSV